MQPGEIFFERFGHNALVVDDPAAGPPLSYNFGFFDPDEPDFHLRFMRGEMEYRLAVLPLAQDLAYYQSVGRGVSIQWLDLDEPAATGLAAHLAWNARPENARYSYDYFLDNCSTRVRDALDAATGGAIARHLQGRSQGNTFRSEAVRLARPDRLMALGFDLGLGPSADRPNALWEDAFVPMRLAQSLRDVRLADGRPLVLAEDALLPHRLEPEPVPRRVAWWPWLLAGAALAALAWSQRHRPRAVAAVAMPAWLLFGAVGALMLYIWFGTAHRFGWANHNLLLSDNAEIDTKPELEIYADDVKCSHGATVGQLDKRALFYLRSRGLSRDEAAQVLTRAFAETIVAKSAVGSVTKHVESLMLPRLQAVGGGTP